MILHTKLRAMYAVARRDWRSRHPDRGAWARRSDACYTYNYVLYALFVRRNTYRRNEFLERITNFQ
jgi:hypothetical protein